MRSTRTQTGRRKWRVCTALLVATLTALLPAACAPAAEAAMNGKMIAQYTNEDLTPAELGITITKVSSTTVTFDWNHTTLADPLEGDPYSCYAALHYTDSWIFGSDDAAISFYPNDFPNGATIAVQPNHRAVLELSCDATDPTFAHVPYQWYFDYWGTDIFQIPAASTPSKPSVKVQTARHTVAVSFGQATVKNSAISSYAVAIKRANGKTVSTQTFKQPQTTTFAVGTGTYQVSVSAKAATGKKSVSTTTVKVP